MTGQPTAGWASLVATSRSCLRPTSVSNGWLERFGLVTWRGVTRGGGSVVVLAAVVVLFGRCVGSGCRAGVGAGRFWGRRDRRRGGAWCRAGRAAVGVRAARARRRRRG